MRDENGKKDVEKEQWYWDEGMKQVREKFEKFDQVILSDESIWYWLSYRKKSVLWDLQKEAEMISCCHVGINLSSRTCHM